MSKSDAYIPDESEQLDQLQPSETLMNRGVADVLDEGIVAPENWSAAMRFGNTPAEMKQGEPHALKLSAEEPETEKDESPWNPLGEKREVGKVRSGRLVSGDQEADGDSVGHDVGISGGAATAEEAAMHVIEFDEDDDDF